jgi:hypothetical protein
MNTIAIFRNGLKEAAAAVKSLRPYINPVQLEVIGDLCRSEERQFFIDELVEMASLVQTMPKTYETDGQGGQAIVQLHYFTAGADWYITERDCEREQLQAFGKADLSYGAELGYISIVELLECGAEIDMNWTPKRLEEI